jgi:hypothetical protein
MRGSENDEQTKIAGHFDLRLLSRRGGESPPWDVVSSYSVGGGACCLRLGPPRAHPFHDVVTLSPARSAPLVHHHLPTQCESGSHMRSDDVGSTCARISSTTSEAPLVNRARNASAEILRFRIEARAGLYQRMA